MILKSACHKVGKFIWSKVNFICLGRGVLLDVVTPGGFNCNILVLNIMSSECNKEVLRQQSRKRALYLYAICVSRNIPQEGEQQ